MEKRAAIYSSRPVMPSMGDMIEATGSNQVCLEYGDKWRLHRRLIVSIVNCSDWHCWAVLNEDSSILPSEAKLYATISNSNRTRAFC